MAQLNRTFFDYLSMAHAERVHSQVLGWLLSLDEAILPEKQKSSFLNSLFGLDEEFTEIEANTEVDSIDIIIETNLGGFLIENKLKSSEHSGQTKKYAERYPQYKKYYLSLIGELPFHNEWKAITYKHLRDSLNLITISKSFRESYFLEDYQLTVNNLVTTYEAFLLNPSAYPNVFSDGAKTKSQKKPCEDKDSIYNYIRVNQLETIFQKAYLHEIMRKIDFDNYYEVNESHGNALLQVVVFGVDYNGKGYNIGFQLQADTFKINIASTNYHVSSISEIDDKLLNSFKEVYLNKNGYYRFNKARSKAYLSVSKQKEKGIKSDEIAIEIKAEIDFIISQQSEFENKLKSTNQY